MSAQPTEFGALLADLRGQRGLTQEQLAERADLSVDAVGALERGARGRPRAETVCKLARALDASPYERAALALAAKHTLADAATVSQSLAALHALMAAMSLVAADLERQTVTSPSSRYASGR